MQFIDNAPLYTIIRVTGPQHNILRLQLSTIRSETPPIIETLNADASNIGALSPKDVLSQVMLGINQASHEFKKSFYVEKIQYVTTDSLPITIYQELAKEIVRRISSS